MPRQKKRKVPRTRITQIGDWWYVTFSVYIDKLKRWKTLRRKASLDYSEALLVASILQNLDALSEQELYLVENVIRLRLPLREILTNWRFFGREAVYLVKAYCTELVALPSDVKLRLTRELAEVFTRYGIRTIKMELEKEYVESNEEEPEHKKQLILKRRLKRTKEELVSYIAKLGLRLEVKDEGHSTETEDTTTSD